MNIGTRSRRLKDTPFPTILKRNCLNCKHCNAGSKCPSGALERYVRDDGKCNGCGGCTTSCIGKVFIRREGLP